MENRVELRIDWTTNQSSAKDRQQIRVKKNGQQSGIKNRMDNRSVLIIE